MGDLHDSGSRGTILGLVAGRGDFPFLVAQGARRNKQNKVVAVAMKGETSPDIAKYADHVEWVYVGQIKKSINSLLKHQADGVIFAGQVQPSRLFKGLRPDLKALQLLWGLKERNAETLFSTVATEFEKSGLHVLPSTVYMQDALAGEGPLVGKQPGKKLQNDIELGWRIAREVSRLDIGQTVVVKKGTVLAVEGFEGTDKAIKRGGELGFGGVTVVKVAKPNHDMRFDVPCIGMQTVKSLIAADAEALAVQARKTLFLHKDKVFETCKKHGIRVIGIGEHV
ncbi:MAG: UDP-2,3-diacylglucosamine diphosphatase LpxI [Lentisphaeria bacterium]